MRSHAQERGRAMKIAVASQNRRTVTAHAGRCRRFWIYEVEGGEVRGKSLIELPIGQSFHAHHGNAPHPLDDISALICGGMGTGLRNRLGQKSILALATAETDPDRAVSAWLNGSLPELPPLAPTPAPHSH